MHWRVDLVPNDSLKIMWGFDTSESIWQLPYLAPSKLLKINRGFGLSEFDIWQCTLIFSSWRLWHSGLNFPPLNKTGDLVDPLATSHKVNPPISNTHHKTNTMYHMHTLGASKGMHVVHSVGFAMGVGRWVVLPKFQSVCLKSWGV